MNADKQNAATSFVIESLQQGRSLSELMNITPLSTAAQMINAFLGKRGMSTEALFERAGMNRAFGFKVLNGQRQPSRNTLLRLALVLELSIDDTQLLLKCGHHAKLTGHDPRDVVLIKAVMDQMALSDTDELLLVSGLEGL